MRLKRIGAIVIALALVAGLMPVALAAAYTGTTFTSDKMTVKVGGVAPSLVWDYEDGERSFDRDYYFAVDMSAGKNAEIKITGLGSGDEITCSVEGSGTPDASPATADANGVATITITGVEHGDKFTLANDSDEIIIQICTVAQVNVNVLGTWQPFSVKVTDASHAVNKKTLFEHPGAGGSWASIDSREVLDIDDKITVTAERANVVYYTLDGGAPVVLPGTNGVYELTLDSAGKYRIYIDFSPAYSGSYHYTGPTMQAASGNNTYPGFGDFVLRTSGFFNNFDPNKSLYCDNAKMIAGQDYDVNNKSGFAEFTVYESFMQSLSGTVRFKATFTDGSSASASVGVQNAYIPADLDLEAPKTGGETNYIGFILLALAAVSVLTVRKVRA